MKEPPADIGIREEITVYFEPIKIPLKFEITNQGFCMLDGDEESENNLLQSKRNI